MNSALELFLPPVRQWFRAALGEPTPAQELGWPAIAAGQHTLILAPTGSGKTLAAFLACLDQLWRQGPMPPGVRVLYVSPLKALNNDIHRNLQKPLSGIQATARAMGQPLPIIRAAVRTGDTPAAERQRLLRRPPQVLITTPESLHLLLTSKGRDTLRGLTHCIIDEIHALCPNKRGVFVSLLLERLVELNPAGFVRIGLSATQRPLDEVARFLGGYESGRPRPVTIVDTGIRKSLDLQVVTPLEPFGLMPEHSIWPAIRRLVREEIRQHRSTLIFANNRRTVERLTALLNDGEERELARAHHGSVALEVRQQTEQALKEGRLPAVVATASLELGIDMGAVELVCQIESPGSVTRALQRVGRAGHVVGRPSKGRLIAKTAADLLEQAVLAHEMAAGRVEELRAPRHCLDVLAQQIVAMVALESWDVPALYGVVRRAYPFHDLTPALFETVLEMLTGRYAMPAAAGGRRPPQALQPRLSWDRTHNRLHPLPGSQQLALVHGGTIPDTGQYAVYLPSGVRLGELDEEFVYERRLGDTFLLGTQSWRLERIEADHVVVRPAEGEPALVPFWRGEQAGRSTELGEAIGAFLRELRGRLGTPECITWLEREYFLEPKAARLLVAHVQRQLEVTGCLPTDQTVVIEASRDPLGDWQVFFLSPLGNRLHLALRFALAATLRARLGHGPQCFPHADGLLVRLPDCDEPIADLLEGLTPENVEDLIIGEVVDSALFALRFRQNAARALLVPRPQPGRRAPLWLQRLRGRDLLQIARQYPDFPIVAETIRECLHEHFDVPRLRQLLEDIRAGRVEVVTRRLDAPSPFAAAVLFQFRAASIYQPDGTEREPHSPALDPQLLRQLLTPDPQALALDPRAIEQVERRLRYLDREPRSATELAEWLRRFGDLRTGEVTHAMQPLLAELEAEGRACRITLPRLGDGERWILAEERDLYRRAFFPSEAPPGEVQEAAATILGRFLDTHALVGLGDILRRYPFESGWAERQLTEWVRRGRAVVVPAREPGGAARWAAPDNLEEVQRRALALGRQEVVTCPAPQFADFLLRWHHLHPQTRREGPEGLAEVLGRLSGLALPEELWESTILPARVVGYQPRWLDDLLASGGWTWLCRPDGSAATGTLAFWSRAEVAHRPVSEEAVPLSEEAERVRAHLQQRGASFVVDAAAEVQRPPSVVRRALRELLRAGLATNDRFDVVRRGAVEPGEGAGAAAGPLAPPRPEFLPRPRSAKPLGRSWEGRWELLPYRPLGPEEHALFMARLLLRRYGVVSRELALLDPTMPPWRVLYEVLTRMELAGEVRRGYFAEGLSGAQFALPEAATLLRDVGLPSPAAAPAVLLHSLDPANLYGSGAPFDIDLLDGGTRPFTRRLGNWLVLRAGRPILLIEQHGQRLSTLPSARPDDVAAAVACLPAILQADRRPAARRKLTVAQWNGRPVTTTEGKDLLAAVGFVRDYQQMTLYVATP
ncbi:MAG: DEAD/DEAH box helicase [Gemmataceae bacterium]|nr:DEAD/DEAH box helicase [Gemmataceae bacterium]MDW8264317.1 DEAD/DEAH box helicase [Gemmataceae bacterium]